MRTFIIVSLAVIISGCAKAEQAVPGVAAEKGAGAPHLCYTVRNDRGSQTSRSRESVFKTVAMTEDLVRQWVESEEADALGETRAASLYQQGFVERIERAPSGELRYTVRNEHGSRTSRDRQSVLRTLTMNAEQIQAWATAKDASAVQEQRAIASPNDVFAKRFTVRNERMSLSGRDRESVTSALTLSPEQLLAWVQAEDAKALQESRAVTVFASGHVLRIDRGPTGQVQFTVRNDKGSRTSRNQDSVYKTLNMTDEQVRVWVEADDAAALQEDRVATYYQSGYAETISRRPGEEIVVPE